MKFAGNTFIVTGGASAGPGAPSGTGASSGGRSDGAAAMASGKLWFKVPDTMKVTYNGELKPGVFSKDLILALAGRIGVDGATYMAMELLEGTTLSSLVGRPVRPQKGIPSQ